MHNQRWGGARRRSSRHSRQSGLENLRRHRGTYRLFPVCFLVRPGPKHVLFNCFFSRLRWQRHFDEVVASRCRCIDLGRDRRAVLTHDRPDVGTEHDQGKPPAHQVLLMPDVLIGRNQHVESRRFALNRRFQAGDATAFRRTCALHARTENDARRPERSYQTGCATRWLCA